MNKVFLMGRLGKDPKVTALNSGSSVTNFSIATSEKWKNKEGEKQERTTWLNCSAFGKVGENIAKFFNKGDHIFVEGSIRIDTEEKDGSTVYYTKVMVTGFEFTGGKSNGGSGASSEPDSTNEDDDAKPYQSGATKKDDDLPF